MIDLKEVELLVEAGKLRNAELLAYTLSDKQSSGYIDIFTLTLFAKNIAALDAIFHDEEIEPNDPAVVEQNLVAWVKGNSLEEEWWAVELMRLVEPDHFMVREKESHQHDKEKEGKFRAAYADIRQKLNEPSRE